MTDLVFAEVPKLATGPLRGALELARLPTDDLDGPDTTFFGLSDDRGSIGFIGLEGDGPDRLLRSLVVLPSRRGIGYGRKLVHRLEAAASGGVERLHLLTSGAAAFFRGLGYVDRPRAGAPASIAATAQFASLCPASAAYLVKELA